MFRQVFFDGPVRFDVYANLGVRVQRQARQPAGMAQIELERIVVVCCGLQSGLAVWTTPKTQCCGVIFRFSREDRAAPTTCMDERALMLFMHKPVGIGPFIRG